MKPLLLLIFIVLVVSCKRKELNQSEIRERIVNLSAENDSLHLLLDNVSVLISDSLKSIIDIDSIVRTKELRDFIRLEPERRNPEIAQRMDTIFDEIEELKKQLTKD